MKKWFAERKEWFLIWLIVFAFFAGLVVFCGLITLLSLITDDPAAAHNILVMRDMCKVSGGVGMLCILGMSAAI